MPADLCQPRSHCFPLGQALPLSGSSARRVLNALPGAWLARLGWVQSLGLARGEEHFPERVGRSMGRESPAHLGRHRRGQMLALTVTLLLTCGPGKPG